MALTDTKIKGAKAAPKIDSSGQPIEIDGRPVLLPVKLADGNGLYLEVRPTGAKLWRYRYRIGGKENVFALGEYCVAPNPESAEQRVLRNNARRFTLEEARHERIRARDLVRQGIHPSKHRDQQNAVREADRSNTFESVGREWLLKHRSHWTTRHYEDIERTLEKDVFPKVGGYPVRDVSAAMILKILDDVAEGRGEDRKRGAPVVAITIRQWCSGIFAHAVRTQRAEFDPTTVLKGHIKRPSVRHKTPLDKNGIRAIVDKIEGSGFITTRFALKILLYTFVRPGELRQAEWSEFDLDRAVWMIPAAKMKKRDRHLVPLSTQVVRLLTALKEITGGRRYLFPNHRRPTDHISGNALNTALARLGYKGKFSAHGFRATASTELHELGYRSEIIEFQLAHAERNQSKASYNQAQFWQERQAMMQQWADLVDAWSRGDNVIPMSSKVA